MAFNNHSATTHLRALRDAPFSSSHVLVLQRMPTEDTLEHPEGAGRYRRDDDGHTETDKNDTSWFLLHQFQTIRQTIAARHEYVARQSREQPDTERLLATSPMLRGRSTTTKWRRSITPCAIPVKCIAWMPISDPTPWCINPRGATCWNSKNWAYWKRPGRAKRFCSSHPPICANGWQASLACRHAPLPDTPTGAA